MIKKLNATPLVCALAAISATDWAFAQDEATALPTVTVTAPANKSGQASIAGFGKTPSWQVPAQTVSLSDRALQEAGITSISDLAMMDGSVTGSYNTTGYWDDITIRGFKLESAYSYRREGLPYNAETATPLDNKSNLELLKGTSGIQAGISAPGGLVNLQVKRPEGHVRTAQMGWTSNSSILAATDLADRLGQAQEFGLRLNAAHEKLNPAVHDAQGERHLLALATDWRLNNDTLLEAEVEHSRHQQPSVPAFSMLGNVLPSAKSIDPRINLNNQPWSLPVVFQGHVGTLRLTQQLGSQWQWQTTYGFQKLRTQDRIAFPFGCSASNDYSHYCADGSFDLYDFRSENELREVRSLDSHVDGSWQTGALKHQLTLGLLRSLQSVSAGTSAYNPVGTGTIDGLTQIANGDATRLSPVSNRDEASTELYVRDAINWSSNWTSWFGLRHTSLKRHGVASDGSNPTWLDQSFNTPWLATGYQFAPQHQAYVSWGEGVQALVAPSSSPSGSPYANSGQPLQALKTRQIEVGVKGKDGNTSWGVNLFRTQKPEAKGVSNVYRIDGDSLHRGLEGQARTTSGNWTFDGSAILLKAERRNSADASVNGLRPTNVPKHTLKFTAAYGFTSVPGLVAQGGIVHEGSRMATPDNSVQVPAWTQVNTTLRYTQRLSNQSVVWQAGVQNLFDKRAWRSAPYQFDHVYLLPLAPRTFTATVMVDF